eukprot:TRINITY_DN1826_c0_g1_i3.p1 TRINITY_DN1826_c0_g1~~TRINITY_DN1826_c0_g1_i3.p1  ORF type:complete len:505 (+),score=99.62 TRINITY_DN1826_c0_g1_i3:472-1986(+)
MYFTARLLLLITNIPREKEPETFCFILTNGDGSKRFGYCRRFSGETPECFIIVSYFSSFQLFSKILDIVEERRKVSKSDVYIFLKAILAKKCPGPGKSFNVEAFSSQGDMDHYTFKRIDTAYEYLNYVSFEMLFQNLSVEQVLIIFRCILMENRIIIVSSSLAKLSNCILAISGLTHPFSWQHIFIPILPKSMIDYAAAPMPFLIGILSYCLDTLYTLPLEDVLIVDIDSGEFLATPCLEECLPPIPLEKLSRTLSAIWENDIENKEELTGHAFCRFFCGVFKNYERHLLGPSGFDLNIFLHGKDPSVVEFMQLFSQCQMFDMFILENEIMARSKNLGKLILSQKNLNTLDDALRFLENCSPPEPAKLKKKKKKFLISKSSKRKLKKKSKNFIELCEPMEDQDVIFIRQRSTTANQMPTFRKVEEVIDEVESMGIEKGKVRRAQSAFLSLGREEENTGPKPMIIIPGIHENEVSSNFKSRRPKNYNRSTITLGTTKKRGMSVVE